MEFFLDDPHIKRYPPAQTHLIDLSAQPYPDGKRIHISLEMTPFLTRPNLEIVLTDSDGNQAGSTSIVEPTAWKLDLTLHLRKEDQKNQEKPISGGNKSYTLSVTLYYPDLGEVDRRELTFQLPDPA